MNPNMPAGTTLKGLGLNLILEDTECLTVAGSCAEDEWLFHWATPEGRSFLTTDIELAGYLDDGATLNF
tara:strand:- start:1745 stop:1951 length:207 start_codon:yes stop_codon:yes gene_type:complete